MAKKKVVTVMEWKDKEINTSAQTEIPLLELVLQTIKIKCCREVLFLQMIIYLVKCDRHCQQQ
jgi:hypothetical protein